MYYTSYLPNIDTFNCRRSNYLLLIVSYKAKEAHVTVVELRKSSFLFWIYSVMLLVFNSLPACTAVGWRLCIWHVNLYMLSFKSHKEAVLRHLPLEENPSIPFPRHPPLFYLSEQKWLKQTTSAAAICPLRGGKWRRGRRDPFAAPSETKVANVLQSEQQL